MIRVRFAPSPTGYLHIGGARTALFNVMYARSQQGQFILRIEDTDLERSKKEYVDEILDSLTWLDFKWDEIYYQSQRFDIYRQYAQKLIDEGKAYHEETAVILKMPLTQIVLYDLIRGEIKFDTETIKDQVLIKSDGSPTYSFACVVDDALMEITHVIRGEDHISNTPKQIIIYQALGFKVPKFAHLPLIMGTEGRLSKRTGATAVTDYRKMGFLSEAIVNYLMLLGWSPGENQEVIKFQDAIKKFSIKKINKTAAEFSMDKLLWVNAQYLKKEDPAKLAQMLVPLLREKGYIEEKFDGQWLQSVVKLYQNRMMTLPDFIERAAFLFTDDFPLDKDAQDKYSSHDHKKEFKLLAKRLEALNPFDLTSTENAFRELVAELNASSSDLVHPVRIVLTGSAVGPGLFETMVILGKEKTVRRLKTAAGL